MIKPFKFFSGTRIQYILIITKDSDTTYSIPLDMYGHIMEVAVGLHRENMMLFSPVEYRVENEIGERVTYFYKINNIIFAYEFVDNADISNMIHYNEDNFDDMPRDRPLIFRGVIRGNESI